MARVLVLRQAQEALETVQALLRRGHEPVLLPLAETRLLTDPAPAGPFAGFVATSLQAAGGLAGAFPGDPRPVLCVGERTREVLEEAGFPAAEAGPGTAVGLVARARAISKAGAGLPLLYAAGRVRRPDLEAGAALAGVPLIIWEVYDLDERRPSDTELATVFSEPPSDALLLSVGQADGFAALWARVMSGRIGEGRIGDTKRMPPRLLCLSERISMALPLDLGSFACISPQPKLSSLFDRFLPPKLDYGGRR